MLLLGDTIGNYLLIYLPTLPGLPPTFSLTFTFTTSPPPSSSSSSSSRLDYQNCRASDDTWSQLSAMLSCYAPSSRPTVGHITAEDSSTQTEVGTEVAVVAVVVVVVVVVVTNEDINIVIVHVTLQWIIMGGGGLYSCRKII